MNIRKLVVICLFVACGMLSQVRAAENILLSPVRSADTMTPAPLRSASNMTFPSYWYFQAQGGFSYTAGEMAFGDLVSPAFAFSVGHQFDPVVGTRLQIAGFEGRGGWIKPDMSYTFKYIAGNFDLLVNLQNMYAKYRERPLNVYAVLGLGLNYGYDNTEAEEVNKYIQSHSNIVNLNGYYDNKAPLSLLWTESHPFIQARLGLQLDKSLSDRVSINFETDLNVLSDAYNSKDGDNADMYVNCMLGLKIRIGKIKYKPIEGRRSNRLSIPEMITESRPFIEEEMPQVVHITQNIFFDLNKSIIKASEEPKIQALASFLAANPAARVSLVGYADRNTGNASINLRLSQERAKAVANVLMTRYGIEAGRISLDWKGDSIQPFVEDFTKNRCVICVTME